MNLSKVHVVFYLVILCFVIGLPIYQNYVRMDLVEEVRLITSKNIEISKKYKATIEKCEKRLKELESRIKKCEVQKDKNAE